MPLRSPLPASPPPLRTFQPSDLRRFEYTFNRTPIFHTITTQQISTLHATISTQLDTAQLTSRPTMFFLARPPPQVRRCVWVCFVKPFTLDGTWFESLFLLGDTISTATFPKICYSNDTSLSYHINWPLQPQFIVSTPRSTRYHEQVSIHRLLAFTFLFDINRREPYHTDWHVDHVNRVHRHNYVNNLVILPSDIHNRSRKRARIR